MSEPLVLREYEPRDVALSAETAATLATAAGRALTVRPLDRPGMWRVEATNYVGSVVIPGFSVLITPKVSLENLFALMDAGMPRSGWRHEVFGYGEDREILPAFAAFFARLLDDVTATGLVRSYRPEAAQLVALRGRIDFPQQLRRPALPTPVACRFDEYTADVPENRYVLGTVNQLLRIPGLDPRTRSLLQHGRARLDEVAPVFPTVEQLEAVSFTRLNEHYRALLGLCRFVIENLTLAQRVGETTASSFLLDMNKLFEDWVTRRLTEALRGRLTVIGQSDLSLDVTGRVTITPDLQLRRHGETVFVGDIKYKLSWSGLARSSDYYQLLAYATALDLPDGVLIYAQVEGKNPDSEIIVRHAGTQLWTYRLDLQGDVHDLHYSIGGLADWLSVRSAAHMTSQRP